MASRTGKLGVGVVGIGWCASQHIRAFNRNPHTEVVLLCSRDVSRARDTLKKNDAEVPGAEFTPNYDDLLTSPDVDIIAITTPNNLHADEAVAAANAGKHMLIEKPTGLMVEDLVRVRDAVREAGVRTIVSFELHYNPYVRFVHWLRMSGHLGNIRFARMQYLSRVLDWYPGWEWVRTRAGGGSHLLAAGCHAVDALRWLSGLEPEEVSAFHTQFTAGYEWPTSIIVNLRFEGGALGHVTSSTDFQLPYTFGVELMGDRASVRDRLITWNDYPLDLEELRRSNPYPDVTLHEGVYGTMRKALRIEALMPDSVDIAHHPFQGEVDELVDCILAGRETHLNVYDAQKTMEICIAADRSAEGGGRVVKLPLTSMG